MRALARIVAVADGPRGTRLAELRGQSPLLPRRTGGGNSGREAQVHLVGGAAGPLGGDRLRIEIEVGPGAALCVRGVAASLALPGAGGHASVLEVAARVGPGGRLRWLPEPLIGAARCDHQSRSTIELAEGAALVWREELVCGRFGETVGDVRVDTTVRHGSRTLLRNDLAVGPRAPGWDGPAALGGGRAAGSVVLVDPDWAATGAPAAVAHGATAALLPLAGGPAVLASAVGPDLAAVRSGLAAVQADLAAVRSGLAAVRADLAAGEPPAVAPPALAAARSAGSDR